MNDKRAELFGKKAKELLSFVIAKDVKYAGDVPLSNIKENEIFGVNPIQFCQMRINDKWNRVKQNPTDHEILREELRDIWGYSLIGLLLLDEVT